jgi:ankyrin repeat protein
VHQRGGDGCQPLHFAENLEVAELLLERGADIEARCVDHFSTPVQYLASSRPWVARYLFSRGAKPDIFSAAMAGDQTAVQQLIVANPLVLEERINHVRFPPSPEHDVHNIMTFSVGEGCGPVHAAVAGNQPGMIRLLISLGQSPNQRGGYDEQTPLHLAAWNNHVEAATALLDGGADIDIRSGSIHNNSPAGWAIVAGSADVFELLMDRGAKVLDWFADDARAALRGEFQKFKCASTSDYQRICTRLFNTLEI